MKNSKDDRKQNTLVPLILRYMVEYSMSRLHLCLDYVKKDAAPPPGLHKRKMFCNMSRGCEKGGGRVLGVREEGREVQYVCV